MHYHKFHHFSQLKLFLAVLYDCFVLLKKFFEKESKFLFLFYVRVYTFALNAEPFI